MCAGSFLLRPKWGEQRLPSAPGFVRPFGGEVGGHPPGHEEEKSRGGTGRKEDKGRALLPAWPVAVGGRSPPGTSRSPALPPCPERSAPVPAAAAILAKNEIETSRSPGRPESAGGSARGRVVLPPPLPGP